jgi:hypothetical protein
MQENTPLCSIVTLNYNGKAHLDDCFNSIRKLSYPKSRYEVIMVDNASTDGSADYVEKNFPEVRVLRLEKNYGNAEGANKGFEAAKGDCLVILDNDTKVDKEWLTELVKTAMKDEKTGICGSKVMDFRDPNIIQFAGGYLDVLGSPFHRGAGERDSGQYDREEEIFYAMGCSLLIKRQVLNKLKYFFDPTYFAYYEETDLCWRIKYLGYKVVFSPKSVLWHKGGATASKMGNLMIFYMYRNKIWTYKKNLSPPLRQLILALVSVRMFFTILYRMAGGKWEYGFKVFRNLFDKKESDVDMSKVSMWRQLRMLSPPILTKYTQYFSEKKRLSAQK